MDKQTGPNGFLGVLPSEIIEIPQDSDKSWLTLFYSLPRELAEKWKPAYELPRCPYEVLWTDKYDHIVCDDMFKQLAEVLQISKVGAYNLLNSPDFQTLILTSIAASLRCRPTTPTLKSG